VIPEPNFPVRPEAFIGRHAQIESFRQALQQASVTGRTSSFAILGDWGVGKSSLLLKFANLCAQSSFNLLPVFISVSKDVHDYLRLAESLLDKFAEALLTGPHLQARLRAELRNWRLKRVSWGGVDLERESPRLFLSSGSSLLRHTLKEAWDRFLKVAGLNGAIFFLDDLQNVADISKADLALTIRDQFQSFGIEGLNYSVCFSAKSDYFAETKGLAEPAARFYGKLYLSPFSRDETAEYTRSIFGGSQTISRPLTDWLYQKTLGHPYFLAFICRQLTLEDSISHTDRLGRVWPIIFEQLGREKFRSDIAQLSRKEIELINEFARYGEDELTIHQLGPKFQREYFGRLTDRGLLVRMARGRYKLYHPLFHAFLQQNETEA
jgi:hypothetical protein